MVKSSPAEKPSHYTPKFQSNYRGEKPKDGDYTDEDHAHFADQLMDCETWKKDPKVMAGVKKHITAKKGAFNSIAKLREFSKLGGMEAGDGEDDTTAPEKKVVEKADKKK